MDWNVLINNKTSKNDFTIVRGRKGYQEHTIISIFTEECFTKVLELFSLNMYALSSWSAHLARGGDSDSPRTVVIHVSKLVCQPGERRGRRRGEEERRGGEGEERRGGERRRGEEGEGGRREEVERGRRDKKGGKKEGDEVRSMWYIYRVYMHVSSA